jgi:hypothetical protein
VIKHHLAAYPMTTAVCDRATMRKYDAQLRSLALCKFKLVVYTSIITKKRHINYPLKV